MRTSSYNIYIDLKKSEDYDLLIHGYTGAIDLVSKEVANMLKKSNLDNISDETIDSLEKRGYLTQISQEKEREYIAKIAEVLHIHQKKKKSFLFAISYNCNFRCLYCYLNSISGQGKNWSNNTFTKEMVDRAYEAMLEIEPDRQNHNNTITLYGGEPLLTENYEIVDYIVDKGVQRGYNFYAITNGYDLNHYKDVLGKDKISTVQITLDGMREMHNSRRPHYKNDDSFDQILNNIEIALEKEIRISLRMNTDNSNIDAIPDLLNLFKNKGWIEKPNFNINSALAVAYESCIGEYDGDLKQPMNREGYIDQYFKEINENKEYKVSCQDFGIISTIQDAIQNDNLIKFKSTFCHAFSGMTIFDPIGAIYPCWDVIGLEDHKIGSYTDKVQYNAEIYKKWMTRNTGNIKSCSKCKYALFCGGGCAGQLALNGSEINKSNCDNYTKVFSKVVNEIYDNQISQKVN